MLGNKNLIDVGRALERLLPEGCGVQYTVRSEAGTATDPEQEGVEITYFPSDSPTIPTSDQIRQKLQDLIEEEPIRVVREFRDKLLKECDWVELPSQQNKSEEWHQAWGNYRQTLRDLPSKIRSGEWTPIFDERGLIFLTNWPKPPTN
jgi:hypothetical protein